MKIEAMRPGGSPPGAIVQSKTIHKNCKFQSPTQKQLPKAHNHYWQRTNDQNPSYLP